MKIAIGSTNPSKIIPTEIVFSHHFNNIEIIPVKVSSGVSTLPLNDEEIYKGALNRAMAVLGRIKDAEFGIGIEGGLYEHKIGWVKKEYIIIIDKTGKIGVGSTGEVQIPQKIMDLIGIGKTLGEAIYETYSVEKNGNGPGMVGIATKNYIIRSEALRHGIAFALAPFLNKYLYE